MATTPETATAPIGGVQPDQVEGPRKPLLEVCLNRLVGTTAALSKATVLYQRIQVALQQAEEDPGQITTTELSLKLHCGDGLEVPVPMPTDPAQRVSYMEEGIAFLGEDVVRLWREAHKITTEAAEQCNKATVAAAAAAGAPATAPVPPAPPSPPVTPQPGQQPTPG